jgi:hypothetical protein
MWGLISCWGSYNHFVLKRKLKLCFVAHLILWGVVRHAIEKKQKLSKFLTLHFNFFSETYFDHMLVLASGCTSEVKWASVASYG